MFIFEYLGAFYIWLILLVVNSFKKKSPPSFNSVLHPEIDKNTGSIVDILSNGILTKITGFLITMMLLHALIKIK